MEILKNKELFLWKKAYPTEDMLEYVYLDEKGNRICGNIVSANNPETGCGVVIYMGKAVNHVGTYGNKYLKGSQL